MVVLLPSRRGILFFQFPFLTVAVRSRGKAKAAQAPGFRGSPCLFPRLWGRGGDSSRVFAFKRPVVQNQKRFLARQDFREEFSEKFFRLTFGGAAVPSTRLQPTRPQPNRLSARAALM
jgi:hypothetical protein